MTAGDLAVPGDVLGADELSTRDIEVDDVNGDGVADFIIATSDGTNKVIYGDKDRVGYSSVAMAREREAVGVADARSTSPRRPSTCTTSTATATWTLCSATRIRRRPHTSTRAAS